MALLDSPTNSAELATLVDNPGDERQPAGANTPRHDDLFEHCRRCAGVVFASAKHCSHCGFDVTDHNRQRLVYGAAGMLLTLTVALAPLGLPLLWYAHYHRVQAERGVVESEPDGVPRFLRRLAARQLSLGDGRGRLADFTRGGADPRQRFPPEL